MQRRENMKKELFHKGSNVIWNLEKKIYLCDRSLIIVIYLIFISIYLNVRKVKI